MQGGDFENNDGSGGHSAFETRHIVAEQVKNFYCFDFDIIVGTSLCFAVFSARSQGSHQDAGSGEIGRRPVQDWLEVHDLARGHGVQDLQAHPGVWQVSWVILCWSNLPQGGGGVGRAPESVQREKSAGLSGQLEAEGKCEGCAVWPALGCLVLLLSESMVYVGLDIIMLL